MKRRILLGTYALSAGYYDAYYKRAQRVRALLTRDFLTAFQQVNVLVTPTAPTPAFKLGEKTDDPLSMYLADHLHRDCESGGDLRNICSLRQVV